MVRKLCAILVEAGEIEAPFALAQNIGVGVGVVGHRQHARVTVRVPGQHAPGVQAGVGGAGLLPGGDQEDHPGWWRRGSARRKSCETGPRQGGFEVSVGWDAGNSCFMGQCLRIVPSSTAFQQLSFKPLRYS